MSLNSTLADTLTRIRNAQRSNKAFTIVKSSKNIKDVLRVLEIEGYIAGFQEAEDTNKVVKKNKRPTTVIIVNLKYHSGEPVIAEIDMVSTPGRRVYKAVDSIPKAKGGLGIYILSTSKGVMSDFDARNQNIGGELLCKIC